MHQHVQMRRLEQLPHRCNLIVLCSSNSSNRKVCNLHGWGRLAEAAVVGQQAKRRSWLCFRGG